MKLHKLMFDLDDVGRFGWASPLINNLFEDLIIAMKSLQTQYPKIGKAVIKRTLGGFHVVFPETRLPFEFMTYLTQKLPHDFGQLWWTQQHRRCTLRVGVKPIVKVAKSNKTLGIKIMRDKPQTIRIVYPDGKILYRKEIEEKYGNV